MKRLKKPYHKPQIKQVNLVPEEAVLLGCKTAASPTGKIAGVNDCGSSQNFCKTAVS